MNAPALVVVTTVIATAAATAVTWLAKPGGAAALPTEPAATDAALAQRVAEVERRLQDVLARLDEQAPATAPARTTVGSGVSAAEVEAAVAKYMAAHEAETNQPGKLTKPQALAQLAEIGGDYDKIERVWAQVEASGIEAEVLAHFKALAEASPTDPHVQYLYGAYLLAGIEDEPMARQGEMAVAADAAFDRTLKLDDKHWAARFLKATSLSFWPKITGKHVEALKNFQVLADQQEQSPPQPYFAQTYVFLGNMLAEQGNREQARATYERGLRWFPDHAELKRQLAALAK